MKPLLPLQSLNPLDLEFIAGIMYSLIKPNHPITLFYRCNAAKLHAQMISIVTSLTESLFPGTKKNAVFLSKCGVIKLIPQKM